MKLTDMQHAAVALVKAKPGLFGSAFADELAPREYGWTRQGATRWGCGYAQRLVNAGLLRKDVRVAAGGARYYLTPDGERYLAGLYMSDEPRRANGDCPCIKCGKAYRQHPLGGPLGYGGEQFLQRLCNGDLVKL